MRVFLLPSDEMDFHLWNCHEIVINWVLQVFKSFVIYVCTHLAGSLDSPVINGICEACDELYNALEEGNMLGRACKRRKNALKIIFKLSDISSPQVLINAARLMLAVRICVYPIYLTLCSCVIFQWSQLINAHVNPLRWWFLFTWSKSISLRVCKYCAL